MQRKATDVAFEAASGTSHEGRRRGVRCQSTIKDNTLQILTAVYGRQRLFT
jgi:hypothetical protein